MSSLETLLSRLEKVTGGRGKWKARCPAHEDRDPSLSIGEAQDGRVLIKCFAGCTPQDITAAVGMELWDLAPETAKNYRSLMEHVHRRTPQQQTDDMVIELVKSGKRLNAQDKRRAQEAALRGGKPNGFVDEVINESLKPLPTEYLTSVEHVSDYKALVTEANWYENRLNENKRQRND